MSSICSAPVDTLLHTACPAYADSYGSLDSTLGPEQTFSKPQLVAEST
jgi:hypothetical protein